MFFYIIRTDGAVIERESEREWELEDYYKAINCDCIQAVRARLDHNFYIVLDDSGKIKHKPINWIATALYQPLYDFIVGDVVITTLNEAGDDFGGFELPCGGQLVNLIIESQERMQDDD